jgi:hypothetical protein
MVMPRSKPSQQEVDKEKAIVGYEQAVALWTFAGDQGWESFNVMLVCNSIIIATIGLTIADSTKLARFSMLLPILGLILCIIWYVLTKRHTDYSRYYIMSARELEELYLSDTVLTVSRGNTFAEGKPVEIKLDGKLRRVRMNLLSRTISASIAGYWIILIFVVLYAAALLDMVLG